MASVVDEAVSSRPEPLELPGGFETRPRSGRASPRRSRPGGAALAEPVLWTIVGAALVQWAIRLVAAETVYPWVTAVVVGVGAWGLLVVVVTWARRGSASPALARLDRLLPIATALVTMLALAVWTFVQLRANAAYGTDEVAFDQYAAQLALHGANPYVHSMAPAFDLFNISPNGYTYRLDGTAVTTLSYPALAFEAYLPFLALGWSTQLAVVVNVGAWAFAMMLLFALLPRRLRPAGLLIGSLTTYVTYAAGGVTDMLYLPLLVGAAHRWSSGSSDRRATRYLRPVLLGLAMAIKQTPWLLLPFVVSGVGLDAAERAGGDRRLGAGVAGRYLVACGLGFLVPNLPYLARSPSSWLRGVTTPFLGHTVPAGQGAIGLSLFLRLGGGSLTAYAVLEVVVVLALLAVYLATYPALRPVTWLLPSVALFFASRSFGSYLVAMVPLVLVAAVSDGRPPAPAPLPGAERSPAGAHASGPARAPSPARPGHRARLAACALSGLAVAGILAAALAARPPLWLAVDSVTTTGQLATVEAMAVNVRNTSDRPVAPRFTVDEGGAVTAFWDSRGPAVLAPGRSARYELDSPNFPAQPSIAGGFQVVAFTTSPASVSASSAYVLNRWHVSLVPSALDTAVRLGTTVTVRAHLLDQLDRPVAVEDVPVYLGQVIYAQQGLQYSQAVINGSAPGATPVEAYTDAAGVATFRIAGTQATSDPVYFEANLVDPREYFPYGYSQILAVRFRA